MKLTPNQNFRTAALFSLVILMAAFAGAPAAGAEDQLLAPPLRGSGPEAGKPAVPRSPHAATGHEAVGPSPHAGLAVGKAAVDLGDIEKAEGGKTVAEVLTEGAALADQRILVRAKVVKKNDGIMGRNWLHLRDGSKNADGTEADLTVTSQQTANVGDLLVAEGKVSADKDFGFGYHYEVLLEDAKLKPESE